MASEQLPRLTTAQAAARLAVKPSTLYAYVSRGLLMSERAERGGSTFDPLEVEALADSTSAGRRDAATASTRQGRPLIVLDSPITLVEPDRLVFRGRSAASLARECTFEEAVAHLWALPAGSAVDLNGDPRSTRLSTRLPERWATSREHPRAALDLLRLILLESEFASTTGETPADVHDTGARVIGTLTDGLPGAQAALPTGSPLAARLWTKVSSEVATSEDISLLNAALILSMDHDLAASTMAARVAASARAAPRACLAAALATLTGALHGGVGAEASRLLKVTMASGHPERALAQAVAGGHGTPGFGHLIYRDHDPRAETLLGMMRPLPRYAGVLAAVDDLTRLVRARVERPANVDLALAALAVGADMSTGSGTLLFAIARTAGWIAHIADEYAQQPLRLRPQARYTGDSSRTI